MAVTLIRHIGASPRAVWDAVTDFAAHADAVPLTTMRLDDGPPRQGWAFVARTAVGPLAFDDPMRITTWQPVPSDPQAEQLGEFEIRKEGRLLAGWAHVIVEPDFGPDTCRLVWREQIDLRPLPVLTRPRLLRRAADLATARLFDRAIDRFAATARAINTPS